MNTSSEMQTVAVIDPDRAMADRLEHILRRKTGLRIERLATLESALAAMRAAEHGLFLLNLRSGRVDGLELLLSAAEAENPLARVIVYGREEDGDRIGEALRAGAADHFNADTADEDIRRIILSRLEESQTLAELRRSEARYRNLIESMPVLFYAAEPVPPYRPIYISQAFENLGYPLGEWFENPHKWAEILHPDDREEMLATAERAKTEGGEIDVEYRVFTREGRIRWLHDRGRFQFGESGERLSWHGLVIDITEKKEAENALRESESRYRDLYENANDLIYVHDLEGNYLAVNETAEKIFGYSKDEALRMNLRDIVVPEHLERARHMLNEKMEGRENSIYEIDCLGKDGRRITLEINSRILLRDGRPWAVQGIARDITYKKKSEQKLVESEKRYRDLFENANDLIFTLDLRGNFTSMNRTGEILTGYRREEAVQYNISDIIAPEHLEMAKEIISRNLAGEPVSAFQLDIFTKDRRRITVEISTRLTYRNGRPVGVQGIARDITERIRLIEERNRFYKLSLDLLATVDSRGRIVQANPSWKKTLGFDESDLIGASVFDIIHPDDRRTAVRSARQVRRGNTITFELRMRHRDGSYRWFYWGIIAVPNDRVSYAVGRDITERKLSEQKLEHHALHDTLTNLPNRAHFLKHLELAAERARIEPGFRFAVLFLDLDRFKVVNDSLGHLVGDKLLVGIAGRLKECVRQGDVIARLGGDEFTILLSIRNDSDAPRIARRLQTRLSEPFMIENYEVFTSASIGIIISDDADRKPEDYLRDADTAMYRAKESGKARYEIFDREMHVRNMNLLQVETDLRRALERGEFRAFYQPIVDLRDGSVREFEALLRWRHPEFGLVLPNEFISIAEETGLIVPIGEWILREACRKARLWRESFSPELAVSVNLSTKQLMNPNLTSRVRQILDETGLAPSGLKLEVTESSVMDFSETAFGLLTELTEMGIGLSTDDFGTGYSSLSYLHKYPFQRLKIDRSFTWKIGEEKSLAIIRTIVMLGENLGIETVAEGIETDFQLGELKRIGCRLGQGFLYSKPVPAEEAERLLEEGFDQRQTDESVGRGTDVERYGTGINVP